MFQKRHYKAIAAIILNLTDNEGRIEKEDLVERMADYFERDSPSFNRDKFITQCNHPFFIEGVR